MYRKWVYIREAINSGVKIIGDDKLDNVKHFEKYNYWIKQDFFDKDMYVDIIDDNKLSCVFKGLIACYKFYKKFNLKTKKYDFLTFVTIGYKNSVYIDIIIKKWISVKNFNICYGDGYLFLKNGYASINVNNIKFN